MKLKQTEKNLTVVDFVKDMSALFVVTSVFDLIRQFYIVTAAWSELNAVNRFIELLQVNDGVLSV